MQLLWTLIIGLMILAVIMGFHLMFRFGPPSGPIAEIIKIIQWILSPI